MGVACEVLPDGIRIQGRPERQVFAGGTVDSHGDHRIAMSFAVASLRARGRRSASSTWPTSRPRFPDFPGRRAGGRPQCQSPVSSRQWRPQSSPSTGRAAPARARSRAWSRTGSAGGCSTAARCIAWWPMPGSGAASRPTTRPATPTIAQQLDVQFGLGAGRRRADLAGRRRGQSAHQDRAGGRGRLPGRGHAGGARGAAGAPAGLCGAPGTGGGRPRHGDGHFPRRRRSRSS